MKKIGEVATISRPTLYAVLKSYNERDTNERNKGSESRLILNKADIRDIKKIHKQNPKTCVLRMNKIFEENSHNKVSNITVTKVLNELNILDYPPCKKPI